MEERIDLNHIRSLSNIRTEIGDITELVNSIRDNGLLQPVGLWKKSDKDYIVVWGNRRITALRKLGWVTLTIGKHAVLVDSKDMTEDRYLIMNTIENMQRQEISPVELGNIAVTLMDKFHLTLGDVAFRMSLNKSKLMNAIDIYKKVPDKFRTCVGYIAANTDKNGKIGATVMATALNVGLSKSQTNVLLDVVERENVTASELSIIRGLIRKGMKVEAAVREYKNYEVLNLSIVVRRNVASELEKNRGRKIHAIMYDYIYDKVKIPKNLIYLKGDDE